MWAEQEGLDRVAPVTTVVALPGIPAGVTAAARGAMRGAVEAREPAGEEAERQRFCAEARFWRWREEPVAVEAVATPVPPVAPPGPPGVLEAAAPREERVQVAAVAMTEVVEAAGVVVTPGVGMGAVTSDRPTLTTVVTVEVLVKIFPGV